MKRLVLIGGPMGVGKTSVGRELQKLLPRCAFLDGDWCWDMRPFVVNETTKAMVLDNICHVLNGFLHCDAIESIVFCWVMHEQGIIDAILSELKPHGAEVSCFSLVADEAVLTARIRGDIARGVRRPDALERSLMYLPKYDKLNTIKIDTSGLSATEVALEIANRMKESAFLA